MNNTETLSLGEAIKLDKEFSLGVDFDKCYDFGSLKNELVKKLTEKLDADYKPIDPTLEKDITNLVNFLRAIGEESSQKSSGDKLYDIIID